MHQLTFNHFVLCALICLAVSCHAKNINIATDNDIVNSNKLTDDAGNGNDAGTGFTRGNEIKVLYKIYEQCKLSHKELLPCLKLKLINAIDKINANKNIEVLRGIYLVKDSEDVPSNSTGDEQRSASSVDDVIDEKIHDFFASRSISLKLFELDNQEDADNQGEFQ